MCISGYALAADNSCTKCDNASAVLGVLILSGLLCVVCLLCFWQRRFLISKGKEIIAYFNEKTKNYDMQSLKTKGKILFFFFQIVSTMPTSLNVYYPNPFSFTLELFSLTNVNIINLLSLGCVFSSNFFNRLR